MPTEQRSDAAPATSGWRELFLTYRVYITAAAIVAVSSLMAFALYRLTEEVRYEDVMDALSDTSWAAVAAAVFFTGLSFLCLIMYDTNALDYVGRRKSFASVAVTAFTAYAVGNTVGFGPLSGGAIRLGPIAVSA